MKVKILWVKGHSGVPGNELADSLAKNALVSRRERVQDHPLVPRSKLKRILKVETISKWQCRWDESVKGRDLYKIQNEVNINYLADNAVVIYFLTGKGSFPSYLHSINKHKDGLCDCGKRGTPIHFLSDSCCVVKDYFDRISNETDKNFMKRILNSKKYYKKLFKIYNTLNRRYSFINYNFQFQE